MINPEQREALLPVYFRPDVAVIGGAGHVGLPLALLLAESGLRTLIADINEEALASIRSGILPSMERGAQGLLDEMLQSGRLALSSNPEDIAEARAIILTIGTPVDEYLNPKQKLVKDCVDGLLPYLSDGQLIVLRSTVYPGTTDWLSRYVRQRGLRLKIAFCPERVAQGHAIEEIRSLPQIIAATSPEARAEAAKLFELIAPKLVFLSPIEAELAKLFANAYRYIQFAVANQFYMIAREAGVDYSDILDAIKRDYPRAKDLPSAGFVAGPCLFKDTMQLASFANNQFTLGQAAMLVNEGLVLFLIDEIAKSYELSELTIGLLGMAFKADSDDARGSLSYKLKNALRFRAKDVLTTDPYVMNDPDLLPLDTVIDRSDLLILCAPHSVYRDLDTGGKPVFDIWGHVRPKLLALTPLSSLPKSA